MGFQTSCASYYESFLIRTAVNAFGDKWCCVCQKFLTYSRRNAYDLVMDIKGHVTRDNVTLRGDRNKPRLKGRRSMDMKSRARSDTVREATAEVTSFLAARVRVLAGHESMLHNRSAGLMYV